MLLLPACAHDISAKGTAQQQQVTVVKTLWYAASLPA
jgi:hypothetical protein